MVYSSKKNEDVIVLTEMERMAKEKIEKARNSPIPAKIDDVLPKNHLVRKLRDAIDFDFVHEEVGAACDIKSLRYDPVLIVKYMLIAHLYDIKPKSYLGENMRDNFAYRWFFGFGWLDPMPSLNEVLEVQQEYGVPDVWEPLLDRALAQCGAHGLPTGRGEGLDFDPT